MRFPSRDADAAQLPRRLEEFAALPASRFIPGHGPPGGREILDEQARQHAEVARIVRSAVGPAAARAAIEARFPGRALLDAIPTAIAAFRWRRRRTPDVVVKPPGARAARRAG